MRHPREVDVPLAVDRSLAIPLGEQLVRQVRDLVARGVLCGGDPLPSSRTLAASLGVSRGTVITAWEVLSGEGYLVADRGATRIAPDVRIHIARTASPRPPVDTPFSAAQSVPAVPTTAANGTPARTASHPVDLRPGRAPIRELDTPAWRRAWRDAASEIANPSARRTVPPVRSLGEHLADHLRVNRGVLRARDEVVVTAGVRNGLQLTLRTLAVQRGRRLRVAVENPGYPALRRVVAALGHQPIPIAVDEHGLDPAALPAGTWGGLGKWDVAQPPDAVIVTPGHQYPLGGTMPVSRRLELLRWARQHGALVIEDDYDSELRDTGQPLPALGALDADRDTVVTLGSFTKVLGDGVGVGHLVAPDHLLPVLTATHAEVGPAVSAIAQRALARFMDAGQLQRHTARMRRAYRRRRTLIGTALGDLPGVQVLAMAGGAHAITQVTDERRVLRLGVERGVLVSGLAEYWSATRTAGPGPRQGIVLGLTASDPHLADGLGLLGEVLAEVAAGQPLGWGP